MAIVFSVFLFSKGRIKISRSRDLQGFVPEEFIRSCFTWPYMKHKPDSILRNHGRALTWISYFCGPWTAFFLLVCSQPVNTLKGSWSHAFLITIPISTLEKYLTEQQSNCVNLISLGARNNNMWQGHLTSNSRRNCFAGRYFKWCAFFLRGEGISMSWQQRRSKVGRKKPKTKRRKRTWTSWRRKWIW